MALRRRPPTPRSSPDGVEPPSNGPFVEGTPYYAPTGYPEPDAAKASQLVKEVEQETGKPVRL